MRIIALLKHESLTMYRHALRKKDKRDGTTTHFLTEGTTICGDAITIGTTNPFCVEENNLGGPIYFQNNSFSFWGLTNATCQKI